MSAIDRPESWPPTNDTRESAERARLRHASAIAIATVCSTLMFATLVLNGCGGSVGPDDDGVSEHGISPPKSENVGVTNTTAVKSYTLSPGNDTPYGLAYDDSLKPPRLYVSDYQHNTIQIYRVGSGQLANVGTVINTDQLATDFKGPRGLAFGSVDRTRFLYALTSNDVDGDGAFANRLWRIDVANLATDSIDLNAPAFEIDGREVFGLAYRSGRVYVSYDTSGIADPVQAVRRGILKLRVADGSNYWWNLTKAGNSRSAEAHLPHSGRAVSSGYGRAPAFGLAAASVDGSGYLWGTSYHRLLYTAELATGRGLFSWDSPGSKEIYGLAFGGGYLWAVDRSSSAPQIHQIKMTNDWAMPKVGSKRVRHLKMKLASKAVDTVPTARVSHNFAEMPPNNRRRNQGFDKKSVSISTTGKAALSKRTYDPAGDSSARQSYHNISYARYAKNGTTLSSNVELDVWSRPYRHLVYPHLVNTLNSPSAAYTYDDDLVYQMSNNSAYATFWNEVKASVQTEYGTTAAKNTSAYWRARNVMEYIKEHYQYGNVSNTSSGHYYYHPAADKLMLPFDSASGNEKMSCSSSAFALVGMMRYLGIPARWVGTTKSRGGWDSDGNGYSTAGESATDTSFHRWAEVWMGNVYGWQRFDPTPSSDGPREFSQFELMQKAAIGVSWKDLVLTIGSGYHAPFFRDDWQVQAYNAAPRYRSPSSWTNTTARSITWSNACFVDLTSPMTSALHSAATTVKWSASGRWDLDPDAKLSIYLQRMTPQSGGTGYTESGSASLLASRLRPTAGAQLVSLASAASGNYYRFEIVKEGDSRTGTTGPVFYYQP